MRKGIKIVITIIIIIAIITAIIIIVKNNKKYNLEKYVKPEYKYFAVYSEDEKVGVVDKNGKLLIAEV